MAFNVRIFAYEGLQQMKLVLPIQHSDDSVFQLTQPYLWAQTLVADAAAVASAPNATAGVNILRIEVPDGQAIRYEINPPSRNVVAGSGSPILSGHDQFAFQPGWTISIIDAAGLP